MPKPSYRWYYGIFSIPLYLLALLPVKAMYVLSDGFRFILVNLLKYRVDVVNENLQKSFPEKTSSEIATIRNQFYKNLVDTMVESLWARFCSPEFFKKRIEPIHGELVTQYTNKGQPIILVSGHMGNWEWAGQGLHQNGMQIDVVYRPLSNKWMDWYTYTLRSRLGIQPITMQFTLREMLERKNIPSAITFIADQTPGPDGCYWMEFLNQPTPVFLGVEKLSKKFNYPVIYGNIIRKSRGYYAVAFEMVTSDPKSTPDNWITDTHMRLLERDIRTQPADWLWSHRRWKHSPKTNNT